MNLLTMHNYHLPSDSQDRRETREAIIAQYKVFLEKSLIGPPFHPYFQILHDKINHPTCGIRALFTRRISDYLLEMSPRRNKKFTKKEKSFFHEQLPFILEAVISIQYYHNQILDGKGGVTPRNAYRIKINMLKGNLLERELENYVEEVVDIKWRAVTLKLLRKVLQVVDIGQCLEQDCTKFKHWHQTGDRPHPFEEKMLLYGLSEQQIIKGTTCMTQRCFSIPERQFRFLYRYFERIFLINSPLFNGACALISDHLRVSQKTANLTKGFANYFGIMLQVVNDVSDCALIENSLDNAEKDPSDTFSDLRNRVLTFPLVYHLNQNPDGRTMEYLKSRKKNIDLETITACYQEMIESYSLFQGIELGRKLRDKALIFIHNDNAYRLMINDLCSLADKNQFYTCLFREQPFYNNFRRKKKRAKKSLQNICQEWLQQQ